MEITEVEEAVVGETDVVLGFSDPWRTIIATATFAPALNLLPMVRK